MKRVRAMLFRWLVIWGMSLPGTMAYVDVRVLHWYLDKQDNRVPARASHPPRHSPERLAAPFLTAVERELWRCLQGEHGPDCAGGSA